MGERHRGTSCWRRVPTRIHVCTRTCVRVRTTVGSMLSLPLMVDLTVLTRRDSDGSSRERVGVRFSSEPPASDVRATAAQLRNWAGISTSMALVPTPFAPPPAPAKAAAATAAMAEAPVRGAALSKAGSSRASISGMVGGHITSDSRAKACREGSRARAQVWQRVLACVHSVGRGAHGMGGGAVHR